MSYGEIDTKIIEKVFKPYLNELFSDILLREVEPKLNKIGNLVFSEVSHELPLVYQTASDNF
jgi:hypothetical protein